MKLKLTTALCLMWAVVMFSPLTAMTASAQDSMKMQTKDDKKKKKKQKRQDVELKAMKGTMTGKGMESDPNIKEGESLNNPNNPRNPPMSKGGGTSKGASADCEVQFDNRTDLNVKTYVNGKYRGAMGGYDDALPHLFPGYVTVYARADFSDGTYLSWGPQSYTCNENQFIYFKMVY